MLAGIGFFVYIYTSLPPLDVQSMIRPNDSLVFDKNDELIGTISRKEENQENVTYHDLNHSLINSLVGTEDAHFFVHHGVDVLSTINNGINTVFGTSMAGGSSVTQQIIGWSHLDRNDRSPTRKAKEIILAVKAEREIDKQEIMELYFNYFFYGQHNIHGIERASEFYFSKRAFELDFIQSSIMTGTLNAPATFNPLGTVTDDGLTINDSQYRLNNVLLASYNQGYLTTEEYFLLAQVPVSNTVDITEPRQTNRFNSYLDLVRREMEDKYGIDLAEVSLRIYTNMDRSHQREADRIINNRIEHLRLPDRDMNFGFVVSRTQTGEITAVGGGAQYRGGGTRLLNNAIDIQNQPGSAFKPIIAYAPTFEFLHWPNRAPISNAPLTYRGTNIAVRNHDGRSGGIRTMDSALADSRNLTAVRAVEAVVDEVGFEGLNQFLTNLGFEFRDEELTWAYALGGTETGVSPIQMNAAYASFGNGGLYIEPFTVRHFINQETGTKVTNPTRPEQAIDERTAFMMSTSLELSVQSSTLLGQAGHLPFPHATKTGTSNWGHEGARFGIPNLAPRDSWISGFTTEYTMSVWAGFETEGIEQGKFLQWGAQHSYPARVFGHMMRHVANGEEASFLRQDPPEGIVESVFDPNTPAPFRFPGRGRGMVGWFFADNLPTGVAVPQVDEGDFPLPQVSFSNGQITIRFTDVDIVGVENIVVIGNRNLSGSGVYNINDGQTFRAYYRFEGRSYGVVSGRLDGNRLVLD
jgi:penicillin-binding protein 1A